MYFNSVTNLCCKTLPMEYEQHASKTECNAAEADKLPTKHMEGPRC